jgi:hypothetical protein
LHNGVQDGAQVKRTKRKHLRLLLHRTARRRLLGRLEDRLRALHADEAFSAAREFWSTVSMQSLFAEVMLARTYLDR